MKAQARGDIVLDAVVWNDTPGAWGKLLALGLDTDSVRFDPPTPHRFASRLDTPPRSLVIRTLEDETDGRVCLPGDVVMRGTAGEFYPIKPDVFRAKYIELPEVPATDGVAEQIRAVGLDDDTTVNIVRYESGALLVEVVGGPARYHLGAEHVTGPGGVRSVRCVLAPGDPT